MLGLMFWIFPSEISPRTPGRALEVVTMTLIFNSSATPRIAKTDHGVCPGVWETGGALNAISRIIKRDWPRLRRRGV